MKSHHRHKLRFPIKNHICSFIKLSRCKEARNIYQTEKYKLYSVGLLSWHRKHVKEEGEADA